MKRNTIALLLHPFKNCLIKKTELKDAIDLFAQNVISIANELPHLRLNIVLPGYILELINPLFLSQLRELSKRGSLEWLFPGYTEPFLSLLPQEMINDNICYGRDVFYELTGEYPSGFLPPFSNWEPNLTGLLKKNGLNYIVLSNKLLPKPDLLRSYWITENAGESIPLAFSHSIHPASAPVNLINWLEKIFAQDSEIVNTEKFLTIQYMIPLITQQGSSTYRWLKYAAIDLDKHLLNFQSVKISRHIETIQPPGLQYIPSSLHMPSSLFAGNSENETINNPYFLNYLYSYDHVGLLQRKILDNYKELKSLKDEKLKKLIKHQLFFVHDINRLLPGTDFGFRNVSDRLWSYSKLINTESLITQKANTKGGQIRIADFLKNGLKTIILSNKSLKLFIDHNKGGHIFEFDYINRKQNLCAAYTDLNHSPANIIKCGKSKTWFLDHLLDSTTKGWDFVNNYKENHKYLINKPFDYKVHKTSSGIKTTLLHQGSFLQGKHQYPIRIEKVFGLLGDSSTLSFVYQFSNPSLLNYQFKFATELSFSFPGLSTDNVYLYFNSRNCKKVGFEYFQIESITKWHIDDQQSGIRLIFQCLKPLDIWCLPVPSPSQGITMILSSDIELNPSSNQKLVGKISCKKIRQKAEISDVL